GPYLRSENVPLDPWGNEYKYTSDGKTFNITSDGLAGRGSNVSALPKGQQQLQKGAARCRAVRRGRGACDRRPRGIRQSDLDQGRGGHELRPVTSLGSNPGCCAQQSIRVALFGEEAMA